MTAIVLAAGKGTRMKSELPKVLFPVLGRAMIQWVIDALEEAGVANTIVVVGYRGDDVRAELASRDNVEFADQTEQLGTGHAVQICRPQIEAIAGRDSNAPVLVVAGDSPLIQSDSLRTLHEEFSLRDYACLLGTLVKDNPQGLGRIVRDSEGGFLRIVEQKDATETEKSICEVNMSTYLFQASKLLWSLEQLSNENAQSEYYLTDCPQKLLEVGKLVDARPVLKACEALSINTIEELSIVESKMTELGYRCAN